MTSIKVATFKGNDQTDYLKRNEYGFTCILYAMDQVRDYCLALNDTYIDVSHFDRKKKNMFDEDAFREAWIDAIVHNKWVDGIPPAVYWYDDRLEIVSYGKISDGMTREGFLSGKFSPVNKELMQIFLQCHIVEQTGHGVSKIVKRYGPKSYEFGTSMITVTIPFAKNSFDCDENNNNVLQNATVKLNATEEAILKIVQIDNSLTIEQFASTIGKHRSTII